MRAKRYEFPTSVRRDAVRRAQGRCEAVGPLYGLDAGQRCNGDLGRGFEIDHYRLAATEEGSDTLDNAVVCCSVCHRQKTSHYDVPAQAKSKRVSDKHLGIRKAPSMRGAGFRHAAPQHKATSPITPKFDGDIRARKARTP